MSTPKAVKCKICGKKYVNKQALIDHIDKSHAANIPEGWNAARYENFLRTGKTEGHCVYCHTVTGWNDATGKYNRMCGSEKCKKIARDKANKNYIGLHGKPYSINNPEQQKKMVYGRKNSGKYVFEGEDGKKYVAMYDSSYGRDFFEMIDTLLSWDGSDIIAPSPHTYWYEYEGKKHFYIPDAYSTSLNLEIEFKDGGDNPNTHPKIQAIDKVKEQKKDEVMESLKDQVNYIKICNKDYTGFFAMLSRLKQQDVCPLPKWEGKLESITESFLSPDLDRGTCFGWYHLEDEVKKNPGGWDEEQYYKDLDSAIRQELSSLSLHQKQGGVIRYVYTLGKEYRAVLLGTITIKWYDYWDHVDPQYEFFWESQEEVNLDDIDTVKNPVLESLNKKDIDSVIPLSKGFLRRQHDLRNPLLNYTDLMSSYRKKLFHENLKPDEWQTLYNELICVRDYLKKVINGQSDEDRRMNYEAKKALKQTEAFIQYMEEKNSTKNSVTESSIMESTMGSNTITVVGINSPNVSTYISQSPIGKYFDDLKRQSTGELIIDTENEKMIGCVFVGTKKDRGFISNLWVSPDYRKQGYGSKLLNDAISKYGGYDLTVKKNNQIAVNMYKKHGFAAIDFKNSEGNPYYWMKLKSKLTSKDKVVAESVTEAKIIFEPGDFDEYKEFADLDAARRPIGESVSRVTLKTPDTLLDYSKIAKAIYEKSKRDEKKPVGNQNCQLCTWCFEARIRGIDVLPRPIYSPRDVVFSYNGYDIVKNPIQIKIKDKNDVVDTILKNKNNCRYYVHVNWKNSTSGHEFMLAKIDDNVYVLDGQAGLVSDVNSSKGSAYFKNANFDNSYMVRMDDKEFNNELLELNDDSYIIDWTDGDEKLLENSNYGASLGVTESTSTDKVPVYIIAYRYRSPFASMVRMKTHSDFNHVAIALTDDFEHAYTFSRRTDADNRKMGFTEEPLSYMVSTDKKTMIKILRVYVSKRSYSKLESIISEYTTHKNETTFNWGGMVDIVHKNGIDNEELNDMSMVCSSFVDYVLKEAGVDLTKKPNSNLVTPEDLASSHNHNKNVSVVYQGLGRDFLENNVSVSEATHIEAMKDDTKYYPVFIFLSYTGTNMAKLIKAFTHDPYAHSSLSFDTELDHMISFNKDGMVDENIFESVYKKNAESIRYSLYVYMATADEYEAMRNFVDELLGRRSKLKYNILGLTNFIFGRGSEREDKFFCSEFVASVISAGNDKIFNRRPYMTSPYMLAKNKNFVFIKTGILKNYDSKVVDRIVAEKLEEGGFTNVTFER